MRGSLIFLFVTAHMGCKATRNKTHSTVLPAKSQNFLEMCQTQESHDHDIQKTIKYLKDYRADLGEKSMSCEDTFSLLSESESLFISDPEINNLWPIAKFDHLTSLTVTEAAIKDLTPIAKLFNLQELILHNNLIEDITPLEHLKELTYLDLGHNPTSLTENRNQVLNLKPLEKLANLGHLDLSFNRVTNIQPLEGLKKLEHLNLEGNHVSSVGPLASLTSLQELNLSKNKIKSVNALTTLEKLSSQNMRHSLDLFDNPIGTKVQKTEANCPTVSGPIALTTFCSLKNTVFLEFEMKYQDLIEGCVDNQEDKNPQCNFAGNEYKQFLLDYKKKMLLDRLKGSAQTISIDLSAYEP